MTVAANAATLCSVICLVSSTLPSATVNTPYATALSNVTIGGAPPYTYSSPVLPAGLGMTGAGLIAGTPTLVDTVGVGFSVTVTDSSIPPRSVTGVPLIIQVLPQPLTITTSALPIGIQGAPYSQPVQVVGGVQPYSWSLFRSSLTGTGLGLNESTGIVSGSPAATGPLSFKVQVTDRQGSQAYQTITLQIDPQLVISTATALPFALTNRAYSVQFATQPGTGGPAGVTWSAAPGTLPPGLTLDATGLLHGTPAAAGPFSFTIQATDGISPARLIATLNVYPQLVISTAPALHFALANQSYSVQLATQPGTGGPNVTWSAAPGTLPSGLTLDATGLLHGTPTAVGTFSFAIQATDGVLPAQFIATLNVYAPLAITTAQLPNAAFQQNYGPVTMLASGGSGNFQWIASGLPSGLTMSTAGVLGGSPSVAGSFPVTVLLSDVITGQLVSRPYSVTIAYPTLSIAPPAPIEVAAGGSVSVTLAATGGSVPYTWSATGALPQGFTLTPGGLLTGTPSQPGNLVIAVQVTDSQPVSVSTTVNVSVFGLTTPSPLPAGTTTSAYSTTFNAVGGTSPYAFSASGLPAGLSISSSGTLTGLVKLPGTYSFSVQVTDSIRIAVSSAYSLTIAVAGPLSLAMPSLPNGTVNIPYSGSLSPSASGGTPPYRWSVAAGALPPGVSLSSTGVLSGTPTNATSYSFTVQATDGSGATASSSATILINPAGLAITTQSPLTSGIVNVDYPQQILTATGGVAPYTFSITGGSLATGLNLTNGVIGGTPTAAGNFSITITVADHAGTQAQTTLAGNIRPPSTDLVLSTQTLSFALSTGATALPASENVSITSSTVAQILPFTTQVSPGSNWLSLSGVSLSGVSTTPAALVVSLTSQALALAASQTPYAATITLTCNTSTPCAGNTQTVNVILAVTAAPAVLSAVTDLLSFTTTSSPPAASSQPLTIQNSGGSPLSFASIACEASWCTVGAVPMFVYGGAPAQINITANPTGLPPGYYRTTVDISSSGGSASIPVTFLIAQSSELLLAPSGVQVQMHAGGSPGNPNGSFLVSVAGNGTVNWTAAVTSVSTSWLILHSTSGTASGSTPGTVSYSIDPAVTSGLAPQPYYATIEVTAPNTIDSPQDFQVVLNVAPAANPSIPDPQPAGLVFLTQAGATPPSQTVQVFASSGTVIGYQAAAITKDGASWLSVSPLTGTTSAAAAGPSAVSVDPSKLSPGIYYGGVNYSFSSAAVRTVNVTLIVESVVKGPSSNSVHPDAKAPPACTPSALAPAQTGLVDNFSTAASWPTPLSILLLNDCGNAVPNGQVVVTFTNGDPPLALAVANSNTGLYSGTWTPRKTSSQISLNARATAAGFAAVNVRIAGQVMPNTAPVLNKDGTLNGFNPQFGAALAPGTIVQIYGSGLASSVAPAPSVPLPTNLNGTQIIIGGIPAPLFYVSPGQVNAQIPSTLNPNNQYQLIVSANGALTTPIAIQLAPVTPGFAVYPDGSLIAEHADGSLVTLASPAQPGEEVVAYLSGMGDTTTPISDGDAAPSDPPVSAVVLPVVTLNGTPASVLFAGLTPTLVGLYQINFQIPPTTPDGGALVVLTQGTFTSNSTILPVHQ